MKTSIFYLWSSLLLFSTATFAQVNIDHSLLLTGHGVDARISGIDSVGSSEDAVSVKTLQNGGFIYAPATGSNNNLSISISPPIAAYQTGMAFNFISNQAVTGPATLNVNGLGAIPIVKYVNAPFTGCEIQNKQVVTVVYDGTNFQMTSTISIGTPVGTPVATAATGATATQITANWNAASNAAGYYLDAATDNGFVNPVAGFTNLSVGNVLTYNITGLSCGNTYYYRIRGSNGCGQGNNSNTISTPIPATPSAPVATAATAVTGSQLTANWNTATNATGYYLDAATDAGFVNLLTGFNNLNVGNVTSYNITGLSCGNTYYYRVRATDACGTSGNSNTISSSVHLPNVAITLTNGTSTATTANFQEMITVNSSTYTTYENAGLQNVEFTTGAAGTGTVLQAWIESGATNSSTSTVYWVNLGSNLISGNSTLTIYMNFMASSVMSSSGPTGEAPQLSGTYAQYDNGSKVFSFYDNFSGTTLNSSNWTSNSGGTCYTLNNQLTYTGVGGSGAGQTFLISTSTFTQPMVVDEYVYPTNSGWLGFSIPGNYSNTGVLFYYVPSQGGWSTFNGSHQNISGTNDAENTWYVWSGAISGGIAYLNVNYANLITSAAGYTNNTSGNLYLANGGGTGLLQWIRVRNYPPSNTMPGASFGSVQCQ